MSDHAARAERCLDLVDDDGPHSLALLAEAAVHTLLAIHEELAALRAASGPGRGQSDG